MNAPDDGGGGRLPVAAPATCLRAAFRLLAHDRLAATVVVTLNCLAALAGLAGPWLLGRIVDGVEAGTTMAAIDRLALAITGCTVAGLLLTRFARYAGHRLGERALARLRERFVDTALTLPTSVVEHAGTGDLLTRSSGDVATVGQSLRAAAPDVLISAVQIAFVLIAVFAVDPLLGLCGLVGLPVIAAGTRWYLRRARTAYLAEGDARSNLSESLAATAEGARTVEAFRLHGRRDDSIRSRIARGYTTRLRTLFLRNVLFPIVDFSHSLPVVLVLVVGGFAYNRGAVSLGGVVTAGLYLWRLVDPLDRLLLWIEQLQSGGASFARVVGVGAAVDTTPPRADPPVDDRIEVTRARYAYTGDHDVLRGVDLSVRPGERLAIVGPSGAGKSTLGRLLAGMDRPRTGSVTVGGVPVTDLPLERLRRTVVLVTQEHHVFVGTVRDNLVIADPSATDDALRAAFAAVEADWVPTLPAGLDTEVGDEGHALDAQQTGQLALARVLLADPHTVVLDEATAMLDPTSARHVERSMAALLHGRTVIAIAHRLHTAHDADRVAVLEDGAVTELGGHDQLIASAGPYAALWRSWHGATP